MIKFIVVAGVAITGAVLLAFPPKVFAQITTYLGPQGQYLGQSIVTGTTISPTQPLPPAYWGPNGR